jgi:hypothetical protein
MPRYVSPLDEYLQEQEQEKAYLLETFDSELSSINNEAAARAAQIEADTSAPDFFSPSDVPAGMSFDDSVRYMSFVREGARRQGKADLAAELADQRAEVLDDRNRQLRDYLDTRKRLSLVNQKGVLNLWDKDVVPEIQGLRTEIVPSVDKEGNPVYQQVYKKVDEEEVRAQEIADWLGVPPEIAERQVEYEQILKQQAQKAALREQMEIANAANKEARAQERFASKMEAAKRRELFDIISLAKEGAIEPGLIGTVIPPNSLPAKLAMQRVAFERLVGEGVSKQKMAAEIEDAVEKDLTDAVANEELALPTGPDDIEGKQRVVQFVEQSRVRHTAQKKLIRGAIQHGGFEDFGVGSLEKNIADDRMQEIQRRSIMGPPLPPRKEGEVSLESLVEPTTQPLSLTERSRKELDDFIERMRKGGVSITREEARQMMRR